MKWWGKSLKAVLRFGALGLCMVLFSLTAQAYSSSLADDEINRDLLTSNYDEGELWYYNSEPGKLAVTFSNIRAASSDGEGRIYVRM